MKIKTPKIFIPSFEPLGHIYQDDAGNILPSVTTILKAELGLYQFKGVSGAAQRGTSVHMACQFYDEGDLDEATLSEEVRPFFEQYKLALKDYGIVVEQNELMRYHPDLRFAGSIDKVVKINGKRAILDIKTGKQEPWHKWQTAAYEGLMRPEIGKVARYDLYIKPDSRLLVEHKDDNNWGEFTILLAAHNIRKNNNYLPK